jgi:hypothetical protein
MRASEFITDAITSPLGRDEEVRYKSIYFAKSPIVDVINELELRKYVNGDELWYGLIDSSKGYMDVVGILQLEKEGKFYQVRLTQIEEKFKTQGYGSYLYDYAIMNDGITILSDFSQTSGNLGGSKGLWEKLYRQGRFTVCGYNVDTGDIIPIRDMLDVNTKIYNQKEDVVWMASPKPLQESINVMLARINTRNKYRTIEWYGPEVTDI